MESVVSYLQQHGTPSATIEWGYRQLLITRNPIILIDGYFDLRGYSTLVYNTLQDKELELEWALYDDAWFLDVLINNKAAPTPILAYHFSSSNDFALRYDYKLAKEIRGLWCLGSRLVIRLHSGGCDARIVVAEVGKAIVSDQLRLYGLVDKLYDEPQPRMKDLPKKIRSALETKWGQPWELVDVQLLGGPSQALDDEADASADQEEMLYAPP
jgi:hypothetical protein